MAPLLDSCLKGYNATVIAYVKESCFSIILHPVYTLYTPLLPYMHLYAPVIHVYTPYTPLNTSKHPLNTLRLHDRYGQTGSGKTWTMGSGNNLHMQVK